MRRAFFNRQRHVGSAHDVTSGARIHGVGRPAICASFKIHATRLAILAMWAVNAQAATFYVDVNSTNAAAPYSDWATAATQIQDAIDVSTNGDLVLVADGTYNNGGRDVGGGLTNRATIDRAITVQSVNGPATTTIAGRSSPHIRCAYVSSGAALVGFTLSSGSTLRNSIYDPEYKRSGGGAYCAASDAVLSNCVVTGNNALYQGGGVYGGTVNNCLISGNTAGQYGGGAGSSALNNCVVAGNVAGIGAAAQNSTLVNCTVVGNSVTIGSMWTIGGPYFCSVTNSIVVNNSPYNWCCDGAPWCFCCTTPAHGGLGNFTDDPLLVNPGGGDYHLSTNSPCVNSGDNTSAMAGSDLDGNSRIAGGFVDIGAYELQSAQVPGAALQADYTNVVPGFTASFSSWYSWGRATSANWDFGDGASVTNTLATRHAWTAPGDYAVIAQVFAPNNPAGLSATVTVHVATQILYYVDVAGTNPIPPYSSWLTAATNIQDAVEVATPTPGSLVLVTNGIYQFGGRVVYGALSNRLAVTKPITLHSVNGPAATTIQGYQPPGSGFGDSALRCVYMTNGATLSGFTLSGGATRMLGDNNQEQSGGAVWCVSTNAVVTNCVILGSKAHWSGGGVYGGTLFQCTLTGNRAEFNAGGGAEGANLINCTLVSNSSGNVGGGADQCALYNCVVSRNSASLSGGGASSSRLNNCTLTSNSAGASGGGAFGGAFTNCIVYYNNAPIGANYSGGALGYCCTLPLPGGSGNITNEPHLSDGFHIAGDSPCRGAATAATVSGTDIDGQPWALPPSIGCDEYYPDVITDSLTVTIQADFTNLAAGFGEVFTGVISGHATLSIWNLGDGIFVTNRPNVFLSWSVAGDYPITFTAYNAGNPGGISVTAHVHVVSQPVHYVSLFSTNPLAPYFSWETAAASIQDAADAAFGGAKIFVTNGVYQAGGRVAFGSLTNRLALTRAVTVQSVNGPAVTMIQGNPAPGANAVRCVYLTNNAVLIGFTLTNGATGTAGDVIKEQSGGGAWCENTNCLLINCMAVSNTAARYGGGSYGGSLSNCASWLNSASFSGGGAAAGKLNFCVLATNSSITGNGGGSYSNTLNNCVLLANRTGANGGGAYGSVLNYCTVALNTNSTSFFNENGGGAGLCSCIALGCVISNNICPNGGGGGGASASSLLDSMVLNNSASTGGGVLNCVLTNCGMLGNAASGPSGRGGAAYQSTLYRCVVSGNSAAGSSASVGFSCAFNSCLIRSNSPSNLGAVYSGSLDNCTVLGQTNGVAAYSTVVRNSILYYNAANYSGGFFTNSCTTPLPPGPGNFTNAPMFVDLAGGNNRLQTNSPCINSGNNVYVTSPTDLDGRARTVAGTVDMGAYEFQGAAMGEFIAWLQQNNLAADGSADFLDSDGDGVSNWQEFVAGTSPTDAHSFLALLNPTKTNSDVLVSWLSVSNRTYFLQRSTNLLASPPFMTLASDIPGQIGTTTFDDSTALGPGPYFYRVGIQGAPVSPAPPFSSISFAWLQQYGLPTDGSADFLDPDGDGMNNWQEWIAGTNPTNATSELVMSLPLAVAGGVKVTWQSVSNRFYFLQRSTNLFAQPPFISIRSNLTGLAGTISYTDFSATNSTPYFYRVGVQ